MSDHTFHPNGGHPNGGQPSGGPDRLLELLADREVGSLAEEDQRELDALLAEYPELDDGSMEAAAAALMVASLGNVEPMPAALRGRVLGSLVPKTPELRLTEAVAAVPVKRGRPVLALAGWVAAAACLLVAIGLWATRPGLATLPNPGPNDSMTAMTLAEERRAFLTYCSDVKETNWGDWDNPEQGGVTGTVEWSELEQRGYMTFNGLAVNQPTVEQYQLWIIDERGMEQRISGAIFNCPSENGEVIVEIEPAIDVRNAAAFAITIEEPGGTWVSDMSRRVVIAGFES